jgi:acylphosphatase
MTERVIGTLHLFVEGRVQGVGYREFTRRAALRHNLSGWARNRADGSVEVRASGAAHDLDALVEMMRRGPPASAVRALKAVEDDAPPESGGFFIAPTV